MMADGPIESTDDGGTIVPRGAGRGQPKKGDVSFTDRFGEAVARGGGKDWEEHASSRTSETIHHPDHTSLLRDGEAAGFLPSGIIDDMVTETCNPIPGQTLFDRYEVIRQLGEGGMGTVWLVRHLEFDSERALKLIVSDFAMDQQTRARFKREARIMDRLHHPNAVRVYDVRLGKETAFIEMEYVEGQSLNRLVSLDSPMPVEDVAELLEQLCDVLQAANDEGIIHRDLKPSNLMVVEGRPPKKRLLKLLDFGIAKASASEADDVRTSTGMFLGTPHYASPEQIRGIELDARSDIYSIGVILYELLAGMRPFGGSLNALICSHTLNTPPPISQRNPNVAVPASVEQVVMACLAKDPKDRPQTPRDLSAMFLTAAAIVPRRSPQWVPAEPRRPDNPDTASLAEPQTEPSDLPNTLKQTVEHPAEPYIPPTVVDSSQIQFVEAERTRIQQLARSARNRKIVAGGLIGCIAATALAAAFVAATANRQPVKREITQGNDPDPAPITKPLPAPKPYPPRVQKQLGIWSAQGLNPDGDARSPEGWPESLVSSTENIHYRRMQGEIYIPDGYVALGEPDPIDGKPRTLERDDGTKFVRIAGDTFPMGCLNEATAPPNDDTCPAHMVTLSSFYIQTTEVTNAEVERFVRERGVTDFVSEWKSVYTRLKNDPGEEQARKHPAVKISYAIAKAYAQKRGGRLPTEAQWEFTARSRGKPYTNVWDFRKDNNASTNELANIFKIGDSNYGTVPVGSYPLDSTVEGVMDLTGNVRELCRDAYQRYQKIAQPTINPEVDANPSDQDLKIVVRGGSFNTPSEVGHTTDRSLPLEYRGTAPDIGFRLVIECPEAAPETR